MGFFKRIFSRKKEEAAEQALQEITEEFFPEQQEDESRRIGHYVLDYCEQIIESAKELGEEKKEYDIVTSYLEDIETLTSLPEEEMGPEGIYDLNGMNVDQKALKIMGSKGI